jgi:hypothetical protein
MDFGDLVSNNEVFSEIYQSLKWGDGSYAKPLSGEGSVPELAAPYVEFVQRVIDQFDVKSVLECGHGDWSMWRDFKFEGIDYLGFDVADGLSENVSAIFGSENRKFLQSDFCYQELPSTDLLITKDVLQHLSTNDVETFLGNINNQKYLIFCNDFEGSASRLDSVRRVIQPRTRLQKLRDKKSPFYQVDRETRPRNNRDIEAGECRGIDFCRRPFSNFLDLYELVESFEFPVAAYPPVTKRIFFFKKT